MNPPWSTLSPLKRSLCCVFDFENTLCAPYPYRNCCSDKLTFCAAGVPREVRRRHNLGLCRSASAPTRSSPALRPGLVPHSDQWCRSDRVLPLCPQSRSNQAQSHSDQAVSRSDAPVLRPRPPAPPRSGSAPTRPRSNLGRHRCALGTVWLLC